MKKIKLSRHFTPTTIAGAAAKSEITIPNSQQLRLVAFRAAIPMIGFGFMDNLVMITAGEAIDSTFGVTLGISTMAAAGFGQCFSDVAGVTSGGIVGAAVSKLRVPHHGLSQEQLDQKTSRLYSTIGACVGVVTGCLLGMSCLLVMDTERNERVKKAKELQSIFESVMGEGALVFRADRATLFLLDDKKEELWSRAATGNDGIIKVSVNAGIVGVCVRTGEMMNISDVYKDDRFNREVDRTTGFHTRNILVVPIKDSEKVVIGAIEMCNKKKPDGTPDDFDSNDERVLHMMASHITSFLRIVS